MKFFAAIVTALASVACAGTIGERSAHECKPATYQCLDNHGEPGWQVCDVSGKWVFAGHCPPHTVCKFFEENQSPYCIPHKLESSHSW
ncbi:hypothetical protein G6O67_003691 [Ophiocordyceps sinensis]|uniref:Uncharacterized protein n=2 Tax=Ophiocordyceps sinensis TaxID=72228 RepID=A0A8H4V6A0_9HYPO|nr:hypothetical protein OCS_03763 [Ophiocordyceps sinensis CO18]KAF4509522.1 hypothetical protein G6O67_003691 [Ophiocordyceps sinensis]